MIVWNRKRKTVRKGLGGSDFELDVSENAQLGNASVNYDESTVSFHASRISITKPAVKMKTSLTSRACWPLLSIRISS